MVRAFRFKKRRFSRRKRFIRKRRFPKKRYDGSTNVTMKVIKTYANTAQNLAHFIVKWGDNQSAGGVANTVVLQDCAEWTRYSELFRYFKVNGCKTEYHPITVAGATDVMFMSLQIASSPDGAGLTIPAMALMVDYDIKTANRYTKKYVSPVKFRKRNESATQYGSQPWVDVESQADYTVADTQWNLATQGLGDGLQIATMEVTYYLSFKGQRNDT